MKDTEKIVTALHLAPQLHIDKLTDEIFVLRQQTINAAIMKQLQDLMHEKSITELYAIDESKVMQLIKEHKALESIKPYIDELIGCNVYDKDFKEYFIETKYGRKLISEETYELLKGVL